MTELSKIQTAVSEGDKGQYTKGEVKHLLSTVTAEREVTEVDRLKRGDVFWAKYVGGKERPWVCLSCRDGIAVAVAVSTGDSAPKMAKSQCRLWQSVWIGTTVSLFTEAHIKRNVTRPYTNQAHLREIEAALADNFSLRRKSRKKAKS